MPGAGNPRNYSVIRMGDTGTSILSQAEGDTSLKEIRCQKADSESRQGGREAWVVLA